MRGVFQALEAALPAGGLTLQHVPGHAGEIWNEICDIAAKWSAKTVHWLPRQQVDLHVLGPVLPFLWMYLADESAGLPPKTGAGHFCVEPPCLPAQRAEEPPPEPTVQREAFITLSMVTANAQTLGKGPQGYQGKLHFLQQQFAEYAIHAIGIQEARTDEIFCGRQSDYLRLSTGHDRGHYGVEFWLSRTIPYAWIGHTPCYFAAHHLVVLHKDPRRLLVRVTTPHLDCIFCVLHGPQSGRPADERELWWTKTVDLLTPYKDIAPLYVLGDLNATTDEYHVHHFDDIATANTDSVRDFAQQLDLVFTSSMACHHGPQGTWRSPDGHYERRIDHILIPVSEGHRCHYSTVLYDVELGNGDLDHQPVGASLRWTATVTPETRKQSYRTCPRHSIKNNDLIRSQLKCYRTPPWKCDIHSQVEGLNKHIHQTLRETQQEVKGSNRNPRRKPFITDEIWEMRSQRNRLKHRLGRTLTALRRELLTSIFSSWRHCVWSNWWPCHNTGYATLLSCIRMKLGVHLAVLARTLKGALQTAKQKHVQETIDSIPATSSSSQILRLLKPCIGSSNSRKRSRPGLPQVVDAEGEVCTTTTTEAQDRWIQYFAQVECGQRVTTDELWQHWTTNLAAFCQQNLDEPLALIPSLFELERAFRRVATGKALGQDEIPPEICNAFPCEMAKATYTQLMKLAVHGQEDIVHKGGRLAVAYKRGPTNACESYRSLLVSSHIGKTIHRSLRQHQADLYEQYLQGQQVGGRRKIPVGFALHLTRAHLRLHLSQGHSVGIIFLDLTEAFYRVIRPMALGGELTDDAIAAMTHRLGLDEGTLHDLRQELHAQSAVSRIPEFHQRYLRALHTDTHFQLGTQSDHVRTLAGTRPGDSFADVVFGYLWSRVLQVLQEQLLAYGLLTTYPHLDDPGLRGQPCGDLVPFVGPTWCDDLSICLWADTAKAVETGTSIATGLILDLCRQHGMTPNLRKGKTAVLLSLQGKDSRQIKRTYFDGRDAGRLTVIGEHVTYQVQVCGEYKHLGGLIHAKGDMRREVGKRLAMAHTAFGLHRKLVFQNPTFPLRKRTQLFTTLVLTKLTFGMESWDLSDAKTKNKLHVGIMRLYRRLYLEVLMTAI